MSTVDPACKDLADRLADLEQQVEYLEDLLTDPELTRQQRASIRSQITKTRQTIASVREQLAECRASLSIRGIELTQGIQYFSFNGQGSGYASDNSLPLIAQRTSALRVYVDSKRMSPTGPQIPPRAPPFPVYISGRVTVDRFLTGGAVKRVADLTPLNGSIVPRPAASVDRGNPNHTLNFRLPAVDCQGLLRFTVTVFEQGPVVVERGALASARTATAEGSPETFETGAVAGAAGREEVLPSASTQVYGRFEPVPTFRIQPVLVHYTADGLDIPAPTPLEFGADLDFLLKTYPIGRLEFGDCLEIELDESLSFGAGGCGPGWEGKQPGHEGLLTILTNMSNASDIPAIYIALIPIGIPNPCSSGRGNTWVAAVIAGRPTTLAQEVGHALRRKHAPACGAGGPDPLCTPGGPTPCYPNYGNGRYPPGSIGEFGFDVFTSAVYDPATYTDFMGYCPSRWVSPYTYTGLRAGMVERFGEPSTMRRVDDAPQEMLFLNFRVHRDGNVEVARGFHLPKAMNPIEHGVPSETSCELLDSDGRVLVFHRCAPSDPTQDPDGPYLDFAEAIPWVPDARSIRFLRNHDVLHIHEIEETPPEVEFRAPEFQYREEPMSIEWTGRHPDRELTYVLRYSHDGGQTWQALSTGTRDTTHRVNPRFLPGGDRCLFQIVASSGTRTSVAESEPFAAPMKPRVASILSPEPGTEVSEGSHVVLRGGAYSPDFGLGDMEDVLWRSDLDGVLGRGFELAAEIRSAGVHTITLTVPNGIEGVATARTSLRAIARD